MIVREWLLFTAQTPASPSSLRVLVWRRMQHLGALLLHNGVWVLPHIPEHAQAIHDLMAELEAHGGCGFFFFAQPADAGLEQHILARFRAEREQEYTEFEQRCTSFLNELERETTTRKFTFAELEEHEDDLHKLTSWLRKIQTRDFFGGPHHDAATAMLARCREALAIFTTLVYEKAGLATTPQAVVSAENAAPDQSGTLQEDEHQP
jgi:hypothetical protein